MTKKKLYIIIFLLLNLNAVAQFDKKDIEHFHLGDGLSHRWVTCVHQDSRGLLWFGTHNGLNRFDGYKFEVFGDRLDKKNKFSDFAIQDIKEDKKGNFWLATRNGITKFNPQSLEIQNFRFKKHFIKKALFHQVVLTDDNRLFAISDSLIFICKDIDKPKFEFFSRGENEMHLAVFDKKTEQVLIASPSRLYSINKNNELDSLLYLEKSFEPEKRITDFFGISISNDFEINLNLYKGIYKYKNNALEETKFNRFFRLPQDFSLIYKDKEKNYWIASTYYPNQLFYYDSKKDTIYDYGKKILEMAGQLRIFDIFEDNYNTIWLTTGNGIFKIPKKPKLFTQYLANKVSKLNSVRTFVEDSLGNIYIGLRQGIGKINPIKKEARLIYKSIYVRNNEKNSINYFPYKFHTFNHNSLISFQLTDRVDILNLSNNTYLKKELPKEVEFLKPGNYNPEDLFLLARGQLVDLRCVFYDIKNETYYKLKDYSEKYDLNKIIINNGFFENNKNLWLCTSDGLLEIDEKLEVVNHYLNIKTEEDKISVYWATRTNENTFWLGTNKSGLIKLNLKNGSFKQFTTKDGLPNNLVYTILTDRNKYLWMGTDYGLSRMNIETESFDNFYPEDGLTHYEFNKETAFKASDGTFYFGTLNGVNAFHPKEIEINGIKPKLILTKFSKFDSKQNKLLETTNLDSIKSIELAPEDKYFSIDFTLNNYLDPSQNAYAYYLVGYEKDWNYVENENRLRYDNIPAGKYILKIKGADGNGQWTNKATEIPVIINQFFYKQWWFILISFLIGFGIIFGIYRFQLDKKIEKLTALEKLRTKISSDLHDEVGGVLTNIALKLEYTNVEDIKENKNVLKHLSQESRKAMNLMSDVIWSIDVRKDSVQDLTDRMKGYANELFENLNIDHDFEFINLDSQKRMDPHIRQNIYLIFKECLNNIAKHSKANQVFIALNNSEKGFTMKIQDNGTGLLEHKKIKGQGMSNLKMRAKKINAKLEIISKNGLTVLLRAKSI